MIGSVWHRSVEQYFNPKYIVWGRPKSDLDGVLTMAIIIIIGAICNVSRLILGCLAAT
jgi:hypothetical protein